MQEVYQINVIPAHKPWRGFQQVYTTDKEVFDLFDGQEVWFPDLDISELPDRLKPLCVEYTWNDVTGQTEVYKPNGTEDWQAGTVMIDGHEEELEMYGSNLLYNLESIKPELPFILLGTAEAYTE